MRIALVHDLPAGGALRFVRETTRRSVADHQYTLVLPAGTPVDAELAGVVDDVVEVATAGFGHGLAGELFTYIASQRAVAAAIDAQDFDVVLAHPSRHTQSPPLLLALRETPSLYFMHEVRRRTYEHGYQPWVSTRGGVRNLPRAAAASAVEHGLAILDRRATGAATAVIANSIFTAEAIARIHGRQASLCHPGVDLDTFAPRARAVPNGLLSVGALDPTKGHDRALDALTRFPASVRPSLTVVYERVDPVFQRELVARAAAAGTALRLLRGVTDAELAECYATAAATVAFASLEPLGLTVLESIAAGTPVVALRQGGYRETVTEGVNGVLVDADACSLAAGITRALDLARTSDRCAIRASVTGYWTWDRCTEDLDRALTRVVGK